MPRGRVELDSASGCVEIGRFLHEIPNGIAMLSEDFKTSSPDPLETQPEPGRRQGEISQNVGNPGAAERARPDPQKTMKGTPGNRQLSGYLDTLKSLCPAG